MKHAPSRVMFIVPGALQRQTGGSIYDWHIAEALRKNGFNLEVVSVPDFPYAIALAAGIFLTPWLLLKTLRSKPDVIIEDAWAHPSLLLFNVLCRLGASSKLVLIAHLVRWREFSFGTGIAKRLEAVALRRASLVITVSRFVEMEVENLTGGGIATVVARPGSDRAAGVSEEGAPITNESYAEGPRGRGRNCLHLLFAGSCVKRKGVEDLINALAQVRDLPLRLNLAGSTQIQPRFTRRLERLINSLGLADRVTLHGLVDTGTLARLYSAADVFVFPSHYEGYGIVLAEAMKAGLPIIVTDNGAAEEIVSNNENALVLPARDSPALAAAIRKLVEDSAMRERFGRRSRELAERLPKWRDTCDVVLKAIESL